MVLFHLKTSLASRTVQLLESGVKTKSTARFHAVEVIPIFDEFAVFVSQLLQIGTGTLARRRDSWPGTPNPRTWHTGRARSRPSLRICLRAPRRPAADATGRPHDDAAAGLRGGRGVPQRANQAKPTQKVKAPAAGTAPFVGGEGIRE